MTAITRLTPGPRSTGLSVAALVLGVAGLVAAASFTLFPLGLAAAVLGGIAVTRGPASGAASHGQAIAGIVCGVLALAIATVFAVRFGRLPNEGRWSVNGLG